MSRRQALVLFVRIARLAALPLPKGCRQDQCSLFSRHPLSIDSPGPYVMDLSTVIREHLVTIDLGRFDPNTLTFWAWENKVIGIPCLQVHESNMLFSALLGRKHSVTNWASE